MERIEFEQWAADFIKRFPDTGAWLKALPKETRDAWFEDIFKLFELRDAKAMNFKLMMDGIPSRFERDGLPRLFLKTMQEIQFNRSERERKVLEKQRQGKRKRRGKLGQATPGIIQSDPCMAKMFKHVTDRMDAYKQKHQAKYTPGELVAQWTQEASDKFDANSDDESFHDAYRCLKCGDTGLRTHDAVENSVGYCECEAGKVFVGRTMRNGTEFHPAFRLKPEENPFNDALQEI